jgi:DNA primase
VSSIALIPDSITRSVYIQQTAEQFELTEQSLYNELNKIRRRLQSNNQRFSPLKQEPEVEVSDQPKKQQEETSENRTFYDQEYDLVRILILFGARAIEVKHPNENSETSMDKPPQPIEVSVAELIIHEVDRDELTFEDELLQKLYTECKAGVEDNILYEPAKFLRSEDTQVVNFVTTLLSPRHELSRRWLSDYKIETNEEIHRLPQVVKESLYAFKNAKIMAKVNRIRMAIKKAEKSDNEVNQLLQEQIQLEKIKGAFAFELGRIII